MQSSSQSESDGNHDDDKVLPPVRKVTFKDQVAPSQPSDNKPKADRIKSYDFDGWSKFDVEKEATKVDIEEPQPSPTATEKPHIPLELTEKGTICFIHAAQEHFNTPNTQRMHCLVQRNNEWLTKRERKEMRYKMIIQLVYRLNHCTFQAFRAGDLEEAYSYYSRSINFNPSVAAYNNRALTGKLKVTVYTYYIYHTPISFRDQTEEIPSSTGGLY